MKEVRIKTAIENLSDKFLSKLLLERTKPNRYADMIEYISIPHLIDVSFKWADSPEGRDFWSQVARHYREYGTSPLIEELRMKELGFMFFKTGDKIIIGPGKAYFFNDSEDEIDVFDIRKSIVVVDSIVKNKEEFYLCCLRQNEKFYLKPEDMKDAKYFPGSQEQEAKEQAEWDFLSVSKKF